jgi:hypothetical protein
MRRVFSTVPAAEASVDFHMRREKFRYDMACFFRTPFKSGGQRSGIAVFPGTAI